MPSRRAAQRVADGNPNGLLHLSDARRVDPDPVNSCARGDVERLLVGVAESNIGGSLRGADGAEMLSFRRDDPHAAGTSFVEIAPGIDSQAVGDPGSGCLAQVDEQLAVGEGAVGANFVAVDIVVAAAVDVEIFLVG